MRLFDQIEDRDFSQLREALSNMVKRELMQSNPGVIISKGTSLPDGYGFLRQILSPLKDIAPKLPNMGDIATLFDSESGDGMFASGLSAMAHRGMMPILRQGSDPVTIRIIMRKSVPCGDMGGGYFPLQTPAHQLLSLIYAAAQEVPEEIMFPIRSTAEETFGPRTIKAIIENVTSKPVELVSGMPDLSRGSDGFPEVATFMPALIADIIQTNYELKGKLDHVLKAATDKYQKGTYITVNDREFQKKIFDELDSLPGHIPSLTVKPALKVVFNSTLPVSEPEILKIDGALIDLAKVKNMGYGQACVSLSQQVADYIYDEKKEKVIPEQFIEMMKRLSGLEDIPEEDRKELDDRVLGPIRNFFKPDDIVVDKLMDKTGAWRI